MPYKDPEKRREYARQYNADHREQNNARNRAARAAGPEAARASDRARYDRDSQRILARGRARYADNREAVLERMRAEYAASPDRKREQNHATWQRRAHGLTAGQFAEIWAAQEGRCYLCGNDLPHDRKQIHIDHDHACCPPGQSCAFCRRGLTHTKCNNGIGLFDDDPDLMERVAAMLRIAKAQSQLRIAGKPVQDELPLNVTPIRREAAG